MDLWREEDRRAGETRRPRNALLWVPKFTEGPSIHPFWHDNHPLSPRTRIKHGKRMPNQDLYHCMAEGPVSIHDLGTLRRTFLSK